MQYMQLEIWNYFSCFETLKFLEQWLGIYLPSLFDELMSAFLSSSGKETPIETSFISKYLGSTKQKKTLLTICFPNSR